MGTGTFINPTAYAPTEGNPAPARSVDVPFVLAVTGLLVFGLIMLYSASTDFSLIVLEESPAYLFNHQLLWMGLGLAGAYVLSRIDYHYWRKLVVPAMLVTAMLLVGVLLIKQIPLVNSRRFIFEGSVQPSELAKLISVIYLSVWLYAKRDRLHIFSLGFLPLSVILGLFSGLILLQPDLSAAATVIIMGGLLFFLAGGEKKQIALMLVGTIVIGWIVVQFSDTAQQRITEFIAGLKDLTQSSYHVLRSFEAIVGGGVFGRGIGNSISKFLDLPLAHNDSIFAVVAEELGVIGSAFLICLYAMLVWRGFVIARRAPDMLGTLLASGLALWIGVEALINMTVMVGLMPFAGNTLPFISAGGSSLTVMLAAVGILLNISRQQGDGNRTEDEWRSFGATVDLRGRNGRRRVSRARRA